ncbi:MAG TPA: GNAT family N-acetyltransferase [Candidatus Binatia bacterium]|nr:GNAT family N-acetyltransferase [Candidatus Binatia bacterium]
MHPLDNPVWMALTTQQEFLAVVNGQARRFLPGVSTLAAIAEPTDRAYASLVELIGDGQLNMALQEPYQERRGFKLALGGPMPQMVFEGGAAGIGPIRRGEEILRLGAADAEEMLALTTLTKPGPFSLRTHELGTYIGIRKNGKLVAMAGERMKIPGYTEVSAVCTHPEHAGKGYARILMAELIMQICQRDETPFLHVRGSNARAIALYQQLGFKQRVLLHHAVLRKE